MKWAETAPDTVTIIDKQHTTHKTMIKKYIFETRMEVRDYECDIQGIVNNANYLHYTEHTRHLFLKHTGLSFAGGVGHQLAYVGAMRRCRCCTRADSSPSL